MFEINKNADIKFSAQDWNHLHQGRKMGKQNNFFFKFEKCEMGVLLSISTNFFGMDMM